MANDLNRTVLLGRLTRDPELKSTSGGQYFCRFTLANGYKKKQGEGYADAVNFIDCVAWGKTAEAIHKYVSKGQRLLVEGCLRWSSWEGTDGKKQSKVEINVETFQFLQPKTDGGQSEPQSTQPESSAGTFNAPDDDIPF